jgi:GNAT superfamily N-acetyltransferase
MTEIRLAGAADVPALTGVLCRAFDADPVMNWVLRQDAGRAAAFEWMFRLSLALTLPFGHVYTTADRGATALWTPPGKWRWRAGWLRQLQQAPGFVRAVGLRRMPRVLPAVSALEARHPREPHFYLFQLAVDPTRQGRGVGSALLHRTLDACDRDGRPAYLENSNPRNTPLYERQGFTVVECHRIGGDGPPLWLMWREPVRGSRPQPVKTLSDM